MNAGRDQGGMYQSRKRIHGFEPAAQRPRCETCTLRGPRPDHCKFNDFFVTRFSVCNDFKPQDQPGASK